MPCPHSVRGHFLWKPACRRKARTIIIINFGVSQFCGATKTKPSVWTYFARIFCTDFWHGFFARIFCTEIFCTGFLHGFVARICCTQICTHFCTDFCTDFLCGVIARIIAWIFARTLCTDFLGCPKALAEKRQKSTEKIP